MIYILLTEKKWHISLFESLKNKNSDEWFLIDNKKAFNFDNLKQINPNKIFIPHWSHLIPSNIYENFECIVFHMTDLPYGRGGSPLQNLIIREIKETKISALKVEKGIDTGDVYLKKQLLLYGTAQEIFIRSTNIIFEMIQEITKEKIKPIPQSGKVVEFKRRKSFEGNILQLESIEKIYDYIRMLDADGYPNAFLEIENFKLEFSRATIKNNKTIFADVRITKK